MSPIEIESVAIKLIAFASAAFPRGTVSDVFGWSIGNDTKFAFVGKPDRLKLNFRLGTDESGDLLSSKYPINRNNYFGSKVERIIGDAGDSLRYNSDPSAYDILSSLGMAIGGWDSPPDVILLPDGAVPWYPGTSSQDGPPVNYYSAKKKKWLKSGKPDFVIGKVEVQEHGEYVSRFVADYCKVFEQMKPEADWKYGQIFRKTPKGNPVLFTHSFSLSSRSDETAKALMACGGLLFPSIAISTAPAPAFMPGVLILDPRVVLNSLKPYREARMTREVVVFNGDAWTPTTSALAGVYAAHLYDELTGNRSTDEYMYNYAGDFYSQGIVPQRDSALRLESIGIKKIDSEDTMLRMVDWYARKWPESSLVSKKKFESVYNKNRGWKDGPQLEAYSFVEAKASRVVGLDCVRVAVVPDLDQNRYSNYLRSAGYSGPIIAQAVSKSDLSLIHDERLVDGDIVELQYARFRYAHAVVKTVAEWDARRSPGLRR